MKKTNKTNKKGERPQMTKSKGQLMQGFDSFTYPDMKRRAISMGMPFPDACAADYWGLKSFLYQSTEQPNNDLINQYDDWMDKQLEELGYPPGDPMRSFQLRLGFIGEDAKTKEATFKKVKGLKSPTQKEKKEKDGNNLWKGTKKSYTFELAIKGYSLERIERRVIKQFPDANPKSIKQWYRSAFRKGLLKKD